MAKVIFYEKPGCANNAKQKALLAAAGHEVEARNLLTEPEMPYKFAKVLPTPDECKGSLEFGYRLVHTTTEAAPPPPAPAPTDANRPCGCCSTTLCSSAARCSRRRAARRLASIRKPSTPGWG